MQSDLPHTLYSKDKKKSKKGKKGQNNNDDFKFNPNDRAIAKQLEANKRRKERLSGAKKDGEYTIDELFNRQ